MSEHNIIERAGANNHGGKSTVYACTRCGLEDNQRHRIEWEDCKPVTTPSEPRCPCGELLHISLSGTSESGLQTKSCPECSRRAGHHVYHLLDQFGRRERDGVLFAQSWCKACRAMDQKEQNS